MTCTRVRNSHYFRPRLEVLEDRTLLAVNLLEDFAGTLTPPPADALQRGDLLVGVVGPDGTGTIDRLRNGSVVPFAGAGPVLYGTPRDIIVDSQGSVVFLAHLVGSPNSELPHSGLFRVDHLGATPELLAVLPGAGAVPPAAAGAPFPFGDELFAAVSSLHLARVPSLVIDDDSAPQLVVEDAYGFAVDSFFGNLGRTGVRSVRYRATTGKWEDGPEPVYSPRFAPVLPDMTNSGGITYSVQENVLRASTDPLSLDASASIFGAQFNLKAMLFGGHREVTSIILDDLSVPNPSVCQDVGDGITTEVPYNAGGSYNVLAGLKEVIVDPAYGLVVTSRSGAAGTPYLTNIDQTLLNEDPLDDKSAMFHRPETGCAIEPSLKFTPILPFWDPATGAGNEVTRLVSGYGGMFGTGAGTVVRVAPGNRVQTLATGLDGPIGLASYPAVVPSASGLVVIVRLDSPVDVLLTDSSGRRLGVDPATGLAVNDFGAGSFDSGPGEPRYYAIRNPIPGSYSVEAVGTGDGPYAVNVYAMDLQEEIGEHIVSRGQASVGATESHDFTLLEDGTIAFVSVSQPPTIAVHNANVTVDEGQTAPNTGTFAAQGTGSVIITASVGSVTQSGAQSGTWQWSLDTSDGPDDSQTVIVTATTSNGDVSTATFELVVNNVAPSLAADNATVTVDEGQTAIHAGTFSDPGNDVVTVTASVGSVSQSGTQSGSWSWSLAASEGPENSQTVIITATDSDGAVSTTTFNLVVNNVPPTATLADNGPVDEGSEGIVRFFEQFDPSTADTMAGFRYSYDFDDDGVFEIADSTSASATVPAAYLVDGPGSRTVRGRIQDKDGGYADCTTSITIDNVAPTATITGMAQPIAAFILPGQSLTFSGTYTDPGFLDTQTATWDFGDDTWSSSSVASGGSGNFTVSHAYSTAGSYLVQLTLKDKDGDWVTVQRTVVVHTPAQATGIVLSVVQNLPLNAGEKRSLGAKLEAAQASMERGNHTPAKNQLAAFKNEVAALKKSKRLTDADANLLVELADAIIAAL